MADFSQPAVQEMLRLLHPALPAGSVLPAMPDAAPSVILEDGEDMRRIIRSSDNGSAAGPSGWTGSLLAALVEFDICRFGIIALLKVDLTDYPIISFTPSPSPPRCLLLTHAVSFLCFTPLSLSTSATQHVVVRGDHCQREL